jgi:hypothetical protein
MFWLVIAWGWTVLAGGGGFLLLLREGPWPLTNGWFALFSGLSACPATAWLYRKCFGRKLSGRVQLIAAIAFFLAGRIALIIEHRA